MTLSRPISPKIIVAILFCLVTVSVPMWIYLNHQKSILEKVKDRGKLNCGVYGDLPGFSDIDQSKINSVEGNLEEQYQENTFGFDVDICKAIAAAIFDNPEKVKYEYLHIQESFTLGKNLKSKKYDVLSRNTTWTAERDISKNVEFAPIVFYDGQGILVRTNIGVTSLKDLNGKAICVLKGTTSEKNLDDENNKPNISFKIKPEQSINDIYESYKNNECEAITSDKSQLAGMLSEMVKEEENPDEHTILEETLSKEPLAPVVIDSDQQWVEIVRWVIFALIEAEELGINQNNLEQMKASKDPKIRRFLGLDQQDKSVGSLLGLEPDYAQRIIRHVGNYGEIYERHFGLNTSTPIPRGLNNLWNNKDPEKRGLIYSPPF